MGHTGHPHSAQNGLGLLLDQLVCDATLKVPGDFIVTIPLAISHLSPSLITGPLGPPDLQSSEYVFTHCDAHRTPLHRPYKDPFQVLERGPKTFKIDFGRKPDSLCRPP